MLLIETFTRLCPGNVASCGTDWARLMDEFKDSGTSASQLPAGHRSGVVLQSRLTAAPSVQHCASLVQGMVGNARPVAAGGKFAHIDVSKLYVCFGRSNVTRVMSSEQPNSTTPSTPAVRSQIRIPL